MLSGGSKALGNSNDAIDFDTKWAVLASSLREIHTKNASMLSFEELYRNAYQIVLKKRGESLYERVKEFEEAWLKFEVRPRILAVISSALLVGNRGPTAMTTTDEKRVAGERLLKALKQAWEDHNICMNMTTDVLMYMVSCLHYVPRRLAASSLLCESSPPSRAGSSLLHRQPETLHLLRLNGAISRSCASQSCSCSWKQVDCYFPLLRDYGPDTYGERWRHH